MIGSVVGNYRIIDRLSVGGMGTVYRAEHALLGRIAAVKVLHPEMCANKDIVNRFFNEAKATTAIKHPGIVEIFDFGYMPSGHAFLVMEFLEGMTLAQRVKLRGPLPEGEAAMVLRGVCSALAAAHAKGIVHRDLKPDNIFVIPDADSALGERSKILDFGIAKLTDIGLAGTATKTGAVMGTPTYMSPEQCRGTGAVDHRADLYSLGCILYELLAGRPPFISLGAGELIGAHLFMQPEPPSRHIQGISAETEALVMNLLDKQPERRVQTARDLGAYLTQIAQRGGWSPGAEAGISMQMAASASASSTDPTRASFHPTPAPPMFTPVFATAQNHTPPRLPSYARAESVPSVVPKPTTLSSSNGESAHPSSSLAPRKSRALGIMLGMGAAAIIGGVAFFALRGSAGASDNSAVTPASPPAATSQTPAAIQPAAPTPAPSAATPSPPTPAPKVATPEPPAVTPEPKVVAPEPKVVAPEPPVVSTTTPVVPAQVAKAKRTSPAAKPKKAPGVKPTKTTDPNPQVRLIEDDL